MSDAPTIVMVDVAALNPAPYNPRHIDDDELRRLERSIEAFGFVDPIIANQHAGRKNVVVGGHARLKVAKRRAMKQVPVVYIDEPEHREKALNIALNNPKLQGRTDQTKVAQLLKELDERHVDVELTGYNRPEVTSLLERIRTDRKDATAKLDKPARPTTKAGDLIEFEGGHRLLCGDATDADAVARLMGNEHAHLVYTDPPYGVTYADRRRTEDFPDFETIKGDKLRDRDLVVFLVASLSNAKRWALDDAAFYIWHAQQTRRDFEAALDYLALEEVGYIIWTKDKFVQSWADYQSQHEAIFYCQKAGHERRYYGPRTETSVWEIARSDDDGGLIAALGNGLRVIADNGEEIYISHRAPRGRKLRKFALAKGETLRVTSSDDDSDVWHVSKDPITEYEHPTQKPVALAERAIRNSTERGQIVLDLFGGSGSSLIAAHNLGRRALVMDTDRGYCDVIVQRAEREGIGISERTPAPKPPAKAKAKT